MTEPHIEIRVGKRYTPAEAARIHDALQRAAAAGLIRRAPNCGGSTVTDAYRGTGRALSPKWNVRVFKRNRAGTVAVASTDLDALSKIVEGDFAGLVPSQKPVLSIDDVGWGFPLLGVGIGVSVHERVGRDIVPVRFFRHSGPDRFETKAYLDEYASVGFQLIEKLGVGPDSHRVEICTGYVNERLRERLVAQGWEVRVTEIGGVLQDTLEAAYKDYVERATGRDLYYDPKQVSRAAVRDAYRAAVRYGARECPELLKTGWKSLKGYR